MLGMCITHSIASGIGGARTAGDLVARMQMARGMKTPEAKKYVADKLKISVRDLTDSTVMTNVRTELGLGCVAQLPNHPKGMEAKFNIAELLGIEINSVTKFKERAKMFVPASA